MESMASLQGCLPAELRGPSTTIARLATGLSGAGVYRVEAAGQRFVLKVAEPSESLASFRRRLHLLQLAANAELAPRVVHVDEERRAVVSAFVVDRSIGAFFMDPRTRETAIAQLGRTLRRVHELPLPADAGGGREPRELLVSVWSGLAASFATPPFVGDAVRRVLGGEPPAAGRAPVMSHNDVNPTNLVYDGDKLMLLDWDTAGPNEPFYDLATIALFLRMDDETCGKLLAAHDDAPVAALPARFVFDRLLVAVLCGVIFLHLARVSGHAGATGAETLDATPSLVDFYQRMRAGVVSVATADGKWGFGLALVKQSFAL